MVTLFVISVIAFAIFMGRRAYKQEEIIVGNRAQLLEKREGKLYVWGAWAVISILALLISYFVIDVYYETEYTKVEKVWLLGDVETKHNTTAGNLSIFLSIFGWIMGPLSLYWFISNLDKYLQYKNMSDGQFAIFQVNTRKKYESEQKAIKKVNKVGKMVNKGMNAYDSFYE